MISLLATASAVEKRASMVAFVATAAALALTACASHPTLQCQSPFTAHDAGPNWVSIIHGNDGPLLLAGANSGVLWANVKDDGSLDIQGNVDVGLLNWPLFSGLTNTPLGTASAEAGFHLFTSDQLATFDFSTTTGSTVTWHGAAADGAFTVAAFFSGPDGEYGIWAEGADGGSGATSYRAGLARVGDDGSVTAVGSPSIVGPVAFTQAPLLFGGGWDADAGVFWVNAPADSFLADGGHINVELGRDGTQLQSISGVPALTNWVSLSSGGWAAESGDHLALFSDPWKASSAQELDLGGQPRAAELEPDGTLWMVGAGDGGIEVWHWSEGATTVSPVQVTPLGVGFCDFSLFPS